MKNLIITALFTCVVVAATAQTRYGVQASGVLSTASFNDDNNDAIDKDFNSGFGAGVFAEIPVSNKFSVKPGFNFMNKGVRVNSNYTELGGAQIKQNIKANLNYLEVPVLAIYNIKGADGKWFLGAGPSASYGVSGKLRGNVEIIDGGNSGRESFKIDAFKDANQDGADFKRFDYALGAVAGHNFNKNLGVQLNYLHGLRNIAGTSEFEDSNKFKNRNMMLSLKYRI
ncbi:MAG: PorT family protein [Bacteroidia bacterium]|nr:PorT family protein [Bacteroidia bacterium]